MAEFVAPEAAVGIVVTEMTIHSEKTPGNKDGFNPCKRNWRDSSDLGREQLCGLRAHLHRIGTRHGKTTYTCVIRERRTHVT